MRLFVKVTARSRQESVESTDKAHYTIRVKEPPVDGKANDAVTRILAEHFNIRRSQVAILSGRASKNKVVEIS